jgi:ABC-type spermidine/putrescine transport system permease subunit II
MKRLALAFGLLAGAALLAPLAFAVRVSFSPDSFLTVAPGEWSLRWYETFYADRRWTAAAGQSLVVATLAAGVAVLAGTPLAFAVARYQFRGRPLLAAGAILPACAPPAVLGMGLLPLFYAARLWGTTGGLVLAHALLGLPVVYLVARAHLEQVGTDLEAAARGLGASPWQAARRVTLPLVRPAVLAGAAAAFVTSLNETLLTIFLATPDTETLPAVVWPQLRYAASPLVAVASGLSAAAAAVGAWVVWRVVRGEG